MGCVCVFASFFCTDVKFVVGKGLCRVLLFVLPRSLFSCVFLIFLFFPNFPGSVPSCRRSQDYAIVEKKSIHPTHQAKDIVC